MFKSLSARLARDFDHLSAKAKRTVALSSQGAKACALAELALYAHDKGKRLVLVADNAADCLRMTDEMRYFAPHLRIEYFPDWETLPYDSLSPHQDLVSDRLQILHRLSLPLEDTQAVDVLITHCVTASQTIAPPSYLKGRLFFFKTGQDINPEALRARLIDAGYEHVSQVVAPGEFSVRGGLIDIFPMGENQPIRLDLFDNEIDVIRRFDIDTQRSLEKVDEVRILPGREYPVEMESLTHFRARWRETFAGDPSKVALYKDMANGIVGPGIEYYLPLFFDERSTLFDYLNPDLNIVGLLGDIDGALHRFFEETLQRYRFLSADTARPVLPVESLYLNPEAFFVTIKPFVRFQATEEIRESSAPKALLVDRKADNPIKNLSLFLDS